MMTTMTSAEVHARWEEVLDRVARGETITVSRGEAGTVTLSSGGIKHAVDSEDHGRVFREMIDHWKKEGLTLGPDLTIRQLINEGRR
jgi:hypothetical protein